MFNVPLSRPPLEYCEYCAILLKVPSILIYTHIYPNSGRSGGISQALYC